MGLVWLAFDIRRIMRERADFLKALGCKKFGSEG